MKTSIVLLAFASSGLALAETTDKAQPMEQARQSATQAVDSARQAAGSFDLQTKPVLP